jgi:hypothetical protein
MLVPPHGINQAGALDKISVEASPFFVMAGPLFNLFVFLFLRDVWIIENTELRKMDILLTLLPFTMKVKNPGRANS